MMSQSHFAVLLLLTSLSIQPVPTYTQSDSAYASYRLYEDFFEYGFYKSSIRPQDDFGEGPLFVYVKFSLLSMLEVSCKTYNGTY